MPFIIYKETMPTPREKMMTTHKPRNISTQPVHLPCIHNVFICGSSNTVQDEEITSMSTSLIYIYVQQLIHKTEENTHKKRK